MLRFKLIHVDKQSSGTSFSNNTRPESNMERHIKAYSTHFIDCFYPSSKKKSFTMPRRLNDAAMSVLAFTSVSLFILNNLHFFNLFCATLNKWNAITKALGINHSTGVNKYIHSMWTKDETTYLTSEICQCDIQQENSLRKSLINAL